MKSTSWSVFLMLAKEYLRGPNRRIVVAKPTGKAISLVTASESVLRKYGQETFLLHEILITVAVGHEPRWFPPETSGLITHALYSCDSQSIFVGFDYASVATLASSTLKLQCRISSTTYLPNNPNDNSVGLTQWNKMAMEFDMRAYESMEKPVVIAVNSCWVTTYNVIRFIGYSLLPESEHT